MKRTVIVFTLVSIFAKIIAFGRELVLSYFYGAGEISDVFLLSMTLPVTIFGFITVGVTSGYIPVYQKAKTEGGQDAALKFTNNVLNFLTAICLIIIVVYFIIPKQLLGLFASGFNGYTLEFARKFTNISIWAMVLTAIVTVLSGYLQINDQIKVTALISVPLNLGIISTIVIAVFVNSVYVLPVGFLVSSVSQVLFLWFNSYRNGFKYSFLLDYSDKYLRSFLSSLTIMVFSGSLQQMNVLIDRTLATTVTVGGLSIFEYGNKINDFAMGVTIVPISTAIFPVMTKAKDDLVELKKTLEEGIRLSSLIIIPVSVVLILFSDVIVTILYYRGEFKMDDVLLTAKIIKYYGVGLMAFSMREMFLKCFYAVGNVKSPMINSTIGMLCNIILNFVLLKIMGLGGLALATSISAVISVILLYRSLRFSLKNICIGTTILKCLVLFAFAGIACYGTLLLYKKLSFLMNAILIPFILAMFCFGLLYLAATILTKVVSKNDIISLLHR